MIGLGSDKNDIFICKTHSPLTVSTPPSVCSWSHPPPRDLLDNFSGTKRPSLSRSFDWRSQKPSQDMRILLPRLVNNGASSYTFVSWDSPEGIEERRTNTHCCKRQQKCRKVTIKERRQKLFSKSTLTIESERIFWCEMIFFGLLYFLESFNLEEEYDLDTALSCCVSFFYDPLISIWFGLWPKRVMGFLAPDRLLPLERSPPFPAKATAAWLPYRGLLGPQRPWDVD